MSWLYSRALVGEFLEENSLDGEQSVQLKKTPTVPAYLWPDKMTECWNRFPSGMTPELLKESHGRELLMSFQQGFHVSPSVSLESKKLKKMTATCGQIRCELLAKLDQNGCSWKTSQICLLTGTMEPYLDSWPRSGLIACGTAFLLPPLVPITKGIVSGLLPTITATDYGTSQNEGQKPHKRPSKGTPSLHTMARKNLWPTPMARDCRTPGGPSEERRKTPDLPTQVGGKLNPLWVAWLMGWPIGWTDCAPLGMDKYQLWQQKHSRDFQKF